MWSWATSTIGQAIATWLSNILSLVAIGIALIVALAEQKRSSSERLQEVSRERANAERIEAERKARSDRVRDAILNLLQKSADVMGRDLPAIGEMFVSWQDDRGKPLQLRSVRESLKTLRPLVADDVDILFDINEAIEVIESTIHPQGLGVSPRVEAVLALLTNKCDSIIAISQRIRRRS